MTHPERDPGSLASRPLCRRYALVVPAVTLVRVSDATDVRVHSIFWVFGWLADGECEVLGACAGVETLPWMLAGLKARGAERFWHVAALADDGSGQAREVVALEMARAFPGALESSRPHMLPIAEAVVKDIRAGLNRAIRRHGRFTSEAEALDFVAHALQRTERRLDRKRQAAREPSLADLDARMASAAV